MASRKAAPSLPVARSHDAAGGAGGGGAPPAAIAAGPDGTLMVPAGAAVSGFAGDPTVKHVVLGAGVTVAPASFVCCDALETVTVGNGAVISKGTFQTCDSLMHVTLGTNVQVGKLAFQGCDALVSVTVGARAKFGAKAFYNCCSLRAAVVGVGASTDGPLLLPTGAPHGGTSNGGADSSSAADADAADAAASAEKARERDAKLGEVIAGLEEEVGGLRKRLAAALEAARRASLTNEDSAFLLKCPITMQIMLDPVTCPSGHTFEREAIETWLSSSRTNPLTREPLTAEDLFPNAALKHRLDALRAAFQDANAVEAGHFFCDFTGRHLHFVDVKGVREWWVSDFRQNKRHGYLNVSVAPTEGHRLPPPSALRQWELHVEGGPQTWHLTTAVNVLVVDSDGDNPAVVISVDEAQLREELGTLKGLALDKIVGTYEMVRAGKAAAANTP